MTQPIGICDWCSIEFQANRGARHCSANCRSRQHYAAHRVEILANLARARTPRIHADQACPACGVLFAVAKAGRTYCSRACANAARKGGASVRGAYVTRAAAAPARLGSCSRCGVEFASHLGRKFCSEACRVAQWGADNSESRRAQARGTTARRRAQKLGSSVAPITAVMVAARLALFAGCWMCGASDTPLHLDHVKPLSKGGAHMLSNIRPACKPCNSRKAALWYGAANLNRFMRGTP